MTAGSPETLAEFLFRALYMGFWIAVAFHAGRWIERRAWRRHAGRPGRGRPVLLKIRRG